MHLLSGVVEAVKISQCGNVPGLLYLMVLEFGSTRSPRAPGSHRYAQTPPLHSGDQQKDNSAVFQWEAAAGLSAVAGTMAAIYYNHLSPLKEAKFLLK